MTRIKNSVSRGAAAGANRTAAIGRGRQTSQPSSNAKSTTSNENDCVACAQTVHDNDKALECDVCKRWVHQACDKGDGFGITSNFHEALLQVLEIDGSCVMCFCPTCKVQKSKILSMCQGFEDHKAEMKNLIDGLRADFDAMKAQMQGQQQPNGGGETAVTFKSIAAIVHEEVIEIHEKEKKKLNVVLVGVTEPATIRGEIKHADDKQMVYDICDNIGIQHNAVAEVFRDGRLKDGNASNGRPYSRIMKVRFVTYDDKMKFLKGYHDSKTVDSSYARHDLTYREREAERILRDELFKKRNETQGDYVIRRDRDGQPRICLRSEPRR